MKGERYRRKCTGTETETARIGQRRGKIKREE